VLHAVGLKSPCLPDAVDGHAADAEGPGE